MSILKSVYNFGAWFVQQTICHCSSPFPREEENVEGKVVLITGANSG
jgi:hypothetical protein